MGFFDRNTQQRAEIIEGIIREQQLGGLSGPYGVGKSPALLDIVVHALYGLPWAGRQIAKRPVIHIDHETPGPVYRATVKRIAARLGVPEPTEYCII